MHIEGEVPGCVFLLLQGHNSWAELLLLHPAPLNKGGLGRNPAPVSVARRPGITLPGVMAWRVMEEALAVILLGWCSPGPLSLTVITGNKPFSPFVSH